MIIDMVPECVLLKYRMYRIIYLQEQEKREGGKKRSKPKRLGSDFVRLVGECL